MEILFSKLWVLAKMMKDDGFGSLIDSGFGLGFEKISIVGTG